MMHAGEKPQILVDGQIRIEGKILGDDTDFLFHGLRIPDHINITYPDLTASWREDTAQGSQQSGLAGSIRTDYTKNLTPVYFEG